MPLLTGGLRSRSPAFLSFNRIMVRDEYHIEAGSPMPTPVRLSVEATHQGVTNVVGDVGVAVKVDDEGAGSNARQRTHGPVPERSHY